MDDIAFRASEANRLLNEPLLVEAFEKVERELFKALIAPNATDADRARDAAQIRAIRDVRAHLETVIRTGKSQMARRGAPA